MDLLNSTVLKTTDGQEIEVKLGPAAQNDSFFVFSIHKSGSTLLNKIISQVCETLSIPNFQPEVEEYSNGVMLGSLESEVLQLFQKQGYCFSGFRSFPEYLNEFDLSDFPKIFLIRDPRDVLVSHYFSQKFSHRVPPGKLGEKFQATRNSLQQKTIHEYVIEFAGPLKSKIEKYQNRIFDDNLKVYRYEDVVFEKSQWLNDILNFVNLHLDENRKQEIVSKVDIRPRSEDPMQHIRKVTPGDHKEKLNAVTISKLNDIFGDILQRYDYA